MSPKHSDPSWSNHRKDSKTGRDLQAHARAPYNFIPLPERSIPAEGVPNQDRYQSGTLTGWIDCELEAKSPLYIRGMQTERQFREQDGKGPADLTLEEKELRSPFFAVDGSPVIPGSSLRGLIRSMVEIIGYGRIRWVGKEPSFTFRAVAAQGNDPLRAPYQEVLGRFGANVRAGYLRWEGERWFIRPAMLPSEKKWPEKSAYLKVKEKNIGALALPGYLRLNSPNYRPQIHPVTFDATVCKGEKGLYIAVTKIGPRSDNLGYKGMLVCSGNMLETMPKGKPSPRKNHVLVLEPSTRPELQIDEQAVTDYRHSLTVFQTENLQDWGGGDWGCLKDGAPVFYVEPEKGQPVRCFGHSPNFRVLSQAEGGGHAVTPADFIPRAHREFDQPDLAEALFGWTPEPGSARATSRAGRVFVGDAHLTTNLRDAWYAMEAITPHVLSNPKPSTFQHYLVQDREKGHDPDAKEHLAHFNTSINETQLRGHKQYWPRGRNPNIEASATEREHEKQLTRIRPLKPGVRFSFRVRFENLRPAELGALLWALQPRGETDKVYCHRLGMGKPLGMGAVQIDQASLALTDRCEGSRYRELFTRTEDVGLAWQQGAQPGDDSPYRDAFEHYILAHLPGTREPFWCQERIQELLSMLEWRGDDPGADWLDWTRYMEIEHESEQGGKLNEYKERLVLPRPRVAASWATARNTPGGEPHRLAETAARQPGREHAPERRAEPPVETRAASTSGAPEPPSAIPRPGDILHGAVLDIEPNGTVWLQIAGLPHPPQIEVTGIIRPADLAGKKFSEGMTARLEVIQVKVGAGEWLIVCRPGQKLK